MITTTRKIWNQKILESPFKEVGGIPVQFVNGNKYEDTGEVGQALAFEIAPTIEALAFAADKGMYVAGTYPNTDATSSIVASTKTIVWKGQDLTTYLEAGDKFNLIGTKFNDGCYTIYSIVFSTNTTIVVTESMVADETVAATNGDYTLVTTQTYTNSDATSSITSSTKTIVFKGQDLTSTIETGDVFWLDGTTLNDGTYTCVSCVFSTDSTIVVEEDLVDETLNFNAETITFTTDVVYTNGSATSSITAATGTIIFKGQDLTDYMEPGDSITLENFAETGNNATFEVATISFSTDSTITVTDNTGMVDETLTTTTETITINDKEIVYTNSDATSSLATDTMIIKAQNISAHIAAGDTFVLANTDSNDGTYTVSTISFSTNTTVTIDESFVTETLDLNKETITVDTN